jgi:hypothetical protein
MEIPRVTIVLQRDSMVVDSQGNPQIVLVTRAVDKMRLKKLDEIASILKHTSLVNLKHTRGRYPVLDFGVLQQRGRFSFHKRPASVTENGKQFHEAMKPICKTVDKVVEMVDPRFAAAVKQVAGEHLDFGIFSYLALNFGPVEVVHKDVKDFKWCCVVPFGNFTSGKIWFPYMGLEVLAREGDLCLLKSGELWHSVRGVVGRRYSIAMSVQTRLIEQLIKCSNVQILI